MRLEISRAYPGDPKTRLVLEADRELVGEVVEFAYRLFEEQDQKIIDSIDATRPFSTLFT